MSGAVRRSRLNSGVRPLGVAGEGGKGLGTMADLGTVVSWLFIAACATFAGALWFISTPVGEGRRDTVAVVAAFALGVCAGVFGALSAYGVMLVPAGAVAALLVAKVASRREVWLGFLCVTVGAVTLWFTWLAYLPRDPVFRGASPSYWAGLGVDVAEVWGWGLALSLAGSGPVALWRRVRDRE